MRKIDRRGGDPMTAKAKWIQPKARIRKLIARVRRIERELSKIRAGLGWVLNASELKRGKR